MKSLQVIRTNLSPYQRIDFIEKEKALLELLPGVRYLSLADAELEQPSVLITNTHTLLSELDPRLLGNTELIIHPNSGYDNFVREVGIWENIPLVVGHEIRAQAVAEYILGCLFQGVLELPQHLHWDMARNWERQLIAGMKIWVFGYGHIGRIVADTLKTLGADVTVVDPYVPAGPHRWIRHWHEHDLTSAGAIIACCDLNSTTQGLFNRAFFERLSDGTIFINGARGGLVDEAALRAFLNQNPHSFAFLDVFGLEPFGEDWLNFPQVWKTSHIAGVHRDLDQGIMDFAFKVLGDFLRLPRAAFEEKYQQQLLQRKPREGDLI